ncbi:MAG TPA: MFS transporter [Gaiellaceae bacterium]|nr:MFS transporter [Gaiellaceae bacterium]
MGYRWVILAAGTFAQSSFAAASVGLPALAPALRSHYGLSLGRTGVVLAATGIGMLFTLLPWGLLADRFNERLVIAAGLSGAGVVLVLCGTTRSFVSLTLALVGAGALGASVNAASGRAIMSWFGPRELGLALGIRQTAIPIGGALGAGLLPVLASAGGTRLAFFFLGGSCMTGALVAGTLIRPGRARVPELTDVTRPLREPRLWFLGAGTAMYLTAQIGITGFVVLFLHDHRHVSTHAAAALLAGINILAIAARIGSGQISDRMGTRLRPLRTIGIALAIATAAVAALVDEPLAALIPAFVIAGVLSMSWNGLAFAAAAEAAGAARTGAALGFQQTLLGVVVAGFAPVFAVIVGVASWRVAFVLAALGPLLGVLALQRVKETRRRLDARTLEMSAIPPAIP